MAGAAAYQVELASSPALFEGVARFTTGRPALALPPLARKATYYWRVRARAGRRWGAWSGVRSFATPAIAVPRPARPAAGARVKRLPLLLDWLDIAGARAYNVQLCQDTDCTRVVRRLVSEQSLATLKRLPRGKYWWRVKALGRRGAASEWSPTRGFTR